MVAVLVTRSQQRVLDAHGIRECHIRIDRHLPTVAMAWLAAHERERQDPPESPQQEANQPTGGPIEPPVMSAGPSTVHRRFSVSSCRNLFDVDGNIMEVGFDHLSHHRPQAPNSNINSGNNGDISNRQPVTHSLHATHATNATEANEPGKTNNVHKKIN